jgi:hypothetical protein
LHDGGHPHVRRLCSIGVFVRLDNRKPEPSGPNLRPMANSMMRM